MHGLFEISDSYSGFARGKFALLKRLQVVNENCQERNGKQAVKADGCKRALLKVNVRFVNAALVGASDVIMVSAPAFIL